MKYKVLSRQERLQNNELINGLFGANLVQENEEFFQELEVKNDRAVYVTKKVKVDPRKRFEGYKVSDFYLENLQACGAIENLKGCQLSGDSIVSIDNAVEGLSQLENINISE